MIYGQPSTFTEPSSPCTHTFFPPAWAGPLPRMRPGSTVTTAGPKAGTNTASSPSTWMVSRGIGEQGRAGGLPQAVGEDHVVARVGGAHGVLDAEREHAGGGVVLCGLHAHVEHAGLEVLDGVAHLGLDVGEQVLVDFLKDEGAHVAAEGRVHGPFAGSGGEQQEEAFRHVGRAADHLHHSLRAGEHRREGPAGAEDRRRLRGLAHDWAAASDTTCETLAAATWAWAWFLILYTRSCTRTKGWVPRASRIRFASSTVRFRLTGVLMLCRWCGC